MSVGTFVQPDFSTQNPDAVKTNIQNCLAVLARLGQAFAPHEQAAPNMTVRIDAGITLAGVEVAAQNTGTITAPTTNPRTDRVVVNLLTGALTVVTGTEAPSSAPPAVPAGLWRLCQITLATTTTAITNSLITDERDLLGIKPGDIQSNAYNAVTSAGVANTYTASPAPPWGSYSAYKGLKVIWHVANTGASTLNVSTLGPINIKKFSAGAKEAVEAGDLPAGQPIELMHDGTDFVIMNIPQAAIQKCRAYCGSAQSITKNVWTKINIDTATFDPNNILNAGNHRIIPTKPGYYQVAGQVSVTIASSSYAFYVAFYKNGALMALGTYSYSINPNSNAGSVVSDCIYLNGSSDYLELYIYLESATYPGSLNISSAKNFLSLVGPF